MTRSVKGWPGDRLQQHVEIAVAGRRGRARAADDQRAGHAARDLQRGRAVAVRMVPEGARGMVGRDVVLVLEVDARIDRDQHVVAVARRIDPQSVRVHVGAVEAVRRVRAAAVDRAGRVLRQLVVQRHAHRLPGSHLDLRPDERRLRIDAGPDVAAQLDLVLAALGRVIDLAFGVLDVEVVDDLARRGRWRRAGRDGGQRRAARRRLEAHQRHAAIRRRPRLQQRRIFDFR